MSLKKKVAFTYDNSSSFEINIIIYSRAPIDFQPILNIE